MLIASSRGIPSLALRQAIRCGTMSPMPNIAAALKSEISRLARKELKSETAHLQRAVNQYRSQIAALKRHASMLEKQIRGVSKPSSTPPSPADKHEEESGLATASFRFSAKGLASHRKRLGLS